MGGDDGDGGVAAAQQAEESRKAALREQINQLYGIDSGSDPLAKASRDFMAKSENELGDSTRSFYNDQLQHASEQAFRKNRFALADRGTLGGSAQIDSERELSRDNTLGATRIADKVSEAVSGLRNSQEQERLNAINLVNAGSGADAVQAAQAGLQRSFDNANSQQKVDLTGGLFSSVADQYAGQANNALMLDAFNRGKLGTFFNPGSGTARVTPT